MTKRRKRKLKSKLRLFIFCFILVGIFAGGFALANNVLWPSLAEMSGSKDVNNFDEKQPDLAKMPGVTVLLMGIDQRGNDTSERTDTLILANINNKDNRISLLSIPRDTKVHIPGYGVNKVNAASLYGGPEMAMQVVSGLTGVPVDYYMLTNFNGFKGIVDALGGVTLDVEQNMYHHDPDPDVGDINLKKGVQELNGDKALQYARFRGYAMGDITRTQHQLKLLTAIMDKTMQPQSITKLPKLVPELYKNVDTNIGLMQAVSLAKAAKNIGSIQIVSQTLPGRFLDENGVSYWYVDDNIGPTVTALFEEGKVVEVVQGSSIVKGENSQLALKEQQSTPKNSSTREIKSSGDADSSLEENSPVDQPETGERDQSDSNQSGEIINPNNQNGGYGSPPPVDNTTNPPAEISAPPAVEQQPQQQHHVEVIIPKNSDSTRDI